MRVIESTPGDGARWNEYVDGRPDGSFFHLFGWHEVFANGLGHRPYYLIAESDGGVCGVLPLVYMHSSLFGKTLSSLPFCTFAGPLSDSDEALRALEDHASRLAHELGVGALEYRLRQPGAANRPTKSLYEIFVKPIDPDPDANMKAIRSKQRNVIRKGQKNGLQARVDTLDNFYPTYAESVRNLGTPVFPRKLFDSIIRTFPGQVEIISACLEDEVISSSMNFFYRDWVCPYYWGGKFAARRLNGNDFLAWEIMQHAAARGSRWFDFGRSKQDTGAYDWKVNLGFEPTPLCYEYELVRDEGIPELNPMNPKYRLMIETWKKLPLPVARILGPLVSRTLG